ncbi:TonB-dependent receptor [Flavobacterium sp. IMCC34518]|uniref:SusC/RagA family TonB-linked outer membrane protein n=1 Tax=Flavobacterium sp. IMCC34518 TaxID=3003623 RepID=UPI0024831AD9|nr:TonB-dependent receptor [Flavobacterium sp. IMCC34518]
MKNSLQKGFLVFITLICTSLIYSQNITGIVTDSNGPLPGVSIQIKGSNTEAQTDFDGSFTIKNTGENTVLIFKYIGFKTQEINVAGKNTLKVIMTVEQNQLNEIVVVGYGTQKKSVVTGAISSVKAKDLEKVPNGRIEQALQGRVSGVTVASNSGSPGSASTIRIRGITTFGEGGNDPLWVIDGVVVDAGGIGFLNQSDIESMEVLKDAASAAIYGTRAATGVILVTTKKGKSGKFTVNYNGFAGFSAPEKTLNLLNASQYGEIMNEKYSASGLPEKFSNPATLGAGTDWQKAIFNTGAFRYSHELSISGGNDVSNFYTSFGLLDQEGIVSTEISNYSKRNFRLNSTHKISKVFTLGQTLGFTTQKTVGIGETNTEYGGVLGSAIHLDPITPIVETDPVLANAPPYSTNPVVRDANGNPYGISEYLSQDFTNPVAYAKTRLGNNQSFYDLVGNVYLEATISKNIKIRSTFGAKQSNGGSVAFIPVFYLNPNVTNPINSYNKSEYKDFAWNIENILTYSNKFGDHNLTVLLGQGSYSSNNGGGSAVTYSNLPITNYRDASFNFDVPASDRYVTAYDMTEHKLTSLFSRVNYDYKEKYIFTGIIRRDGSSRFGENNKFGVFPSFNLGWIASKEDFWTTNDIINVLKIRGGYGVVGNDAIPDFRYLSLVSGGYNYAFGKDGIIQTGYGNGTLNNPDLRWEQTSQATLGFETRFFNSLSLTIDLYKKSTEGILRPVSIPGYVGVPEYPTGNVANMDNKGIEVELGYKKQFEDFNFSANANFAYLKNEITQIDSNTNFIPGDVKFQSMDEVTRTQVGHSYNEFYGFKTAGVFQNDAEIAAYKNSKGIIIQPDAKPGDYRWADTDGNGTIDVNDKQFLGSSIPKYTFGLTLNLDYKNFDFMVFTQGAAGNKIFQGLRNLDAKDANYQTSVLDRWTGEGTSNDYARLTYNDDNGNFTKMSNFFLEDGAYLRLKLIQIGYSLPTNAISIIGATKLRFYVSGENLMTFTKYTGYDPEIGGGVFGIDKGTYPQARSFLFGANLQF